jgi:hypothetical protein
MVHERFVRTAIAALALFASVVGCTSGGTETTSSGGSSQSASSEPLVVEPETCPKTVEFFLKRNDVQGMHQALVPGQPRYMVACDGRPRVAVTDEQQVAAVAGAINALELIPENLMIFDCAVALGQDRALFFTYADGHVLAVQIGAPCIITATNGHRMALLRDLSWREISDLFE